MKHFPGLGLATRNTDASVVSIKASATELAPGLRPYRLAIGHRIPMIMLSNATYPAYDRYRAAGWSRAISVGLLRDQLGFDGVSITDSLNGAAAARGISPERLAIAAANAGTDMILLTGSEAGSRAAFQALIAAAGAGRIPASALHASYDRILAMKAAFPATVSDDVKPQVQLNAPSLVADTTLGISTAWVRTAWTGHDGCRIAAYALARRSDLGDWMPQLLLSPTGTSVEQPLRFGIRYAYSVAGTDGAGNESDPTLAAPFRPRLSQENDPGVRYRGTWRTASDVHASGGAFATSTMAGAVASTSFTGFSIAWIAARGPSHGSASVYVDGAFAAHVNLQASGRVTRQVVFARSWSVAGLHHITIVNLGTAGHPRVDVDGFLALLPT
jgi:hypothetical protein